MDVKSRLIQQLDEARANMRAVLAGIDTEMEIYPGWTAKQLVAHIAGWDDAIISSLRAHAGGEELATPAIEGIDHHNAQTVATREALSYEQVVKECEAARNTLKEAINDVPSDKLDVPMLFPWGGSGTVADLVAIFVHHENAHAAEVAQLKAQAMKA